MKHTSPFQSLPAELQAEVIRTTREVAAFGGDTSHEPARSGLREVDVMGDELFHAIRPDAHAIHSTARLDAAVDRLEQAHVAFDEFSQRVQQGLEAGSNLLGGLRALLQEHEHEVAEREAAEAAQRRLEAEIDRLDRREQADEQATRRARLEDEARRRLTTA